MKNYRKLSTLLFLFLISGAFIIKSCTHPLENVKVNPDMNNLELESPKNAVFIQFIDKESGEAVTGVDITLGGDGVSKLFNIDNETTFAQDEVGFVKIFTERESIQSSVDFNVTVSHSQYLTTTQPISIVPEDTVQLIDINMISISNPPAGVSIQQETFTLVDNQVSEEVVMEAECDKSSDPSTCVVTLEPGTQLLDENGNILSGEVKATLGYFSTDSDESLESFPGGLTAPNVLDENGDPMDPVVFETAGLISMEVTAGGKTVKSFSKPIKVSMELNDNQINAEGEAVTEGSTVPVWSMDKGTGVWKMEGTATITKNSNKKLVASYDVPHLSYWNFDYFYRSCTYGSVIKTTLDSSVPRGGYYARFVNTANNRVIKNKYVYLRNNDYVRIYNAPRGVNVKMELYSRGLSSELITTTESFSLCGDNKTIHFANTNGAPKSTISMQLIATCPDNKDAIEMSARGYVYARKVNTYRWYYMGRITEDGKFSTDQLNLGETYEFYAYGYVGNKYMGSKQFNYKISSTEIVEYREYPEDLISRFCE